MEEPGVFKFIENICNGKVCKGFGIKDVLIRLAEVEVLMNS